MSFRSICIACVVLCASPAWAATPTADEVFYLQRMEMVGKVLEATWKAFEDKGVENRELNALAAEILDATGRKLRASPPSSESVKPAHEQLVKVVDAARAIYDSAAAGKLDHIEALSKTLAAEHAKLETAGKALEERLK